MQKKSKKPALLLFGCFILLICCCVSTFAGVYLLGEADSDLSLTTTSDSDDDGSEPQEEEADSENETEEEIEEDATAGEYVSAQLPDGWTIAEYTNAAGGYGYFATGNYTGLTAIVLRQNDKDVFSIFGAYGIGGVDYCENIYRFPDTPQAYITLKQQEYTEATGGNAQVQDVNAQYTEFELFGRAARLVGTKIYWNEDVNSAIFKPNCSGLVGLNQDIGLSYTTPGGAGNYMYLYKIEAGLNQANAETAVQILDTMEVVANP